MDTGVEISTNPRFNSDYYNAILYEAEKNNLDKCLGLLSDITGNINSGEKYKFICMLEILEWIVNSEYPEVCQVNMLDLLSKIRTQINLGKAIDGYTFQSITTQKIEQKRSSVDEDNNGEDNKDNKVLGIF